MIDKIFDISKMTESALAEAIRLLEAYKKFGAPDDFWDEGVQIAYNDESGCVFLTNDDYQVAVCDGDHLVSVYFTPYDGFEGTFEELVDMFVDGKFEQDDIEYLRDIAESIEEFDVVEMINRTFDTESEVDVNA